MKFYLIDHWFDFYCIYKIDKNMCIEVRNTDCF